MAEAIATGAARAIASKAATRRTAGKAAGMGFEQVLNRAAQAKRPIARPRGALVQAAQRAAAPVKTATLPDATQAALAEAMKRENVPDSWKSSLTFLVQQESEGKVDARNPVHSARGLFQLTRANYHLNPRGEASFGNGVEEAQGGIRYVRQRYGDADRAVEHWRAKRWY